MRAARDNLCHRELAEALQGFKAKAGYRTAPISALEYKGEGI